jgi:hypothetical protein
MSRFIAQAVGVALFLAASLAAQDVTLSARVRLMENDKPAQHTNAEGVVIWLSPIDAHVPPKSFPGGPFKLTQHNKSFQPHLLVVPVGAVVQFPNRDPFFHNVFSLFDGKRFDLGLYEAGSSRNVSFDRPGVSYIFCNIHAEMSAVVISLDTPYYSVSDSKGQVVIPEVPAGRYSMHVWYETALPATLNAMTHEITVSANSSTLGVVDVPMNLAASTHKNKYGMDYEPPAPDSPGYNPDYSNR